MLRAGRVRDRAATGVVTMAGVVGVGALLLASGPPAVSVGPAQPPAVASAGSAATNPAPARVPSAAAPSSQLYVVQAVPERKVEVSVDGESVETASVGAVVGPVPVAAGAHEVTLSTPSWSVTTSVEVAAGRATDVVLHRPASPSGDPVVSSYPVPDAPVGPGKGRVLLAHTATAPPADVRVDGTTVFTNIANGEFATAALPAGPHRVSLLPSGADRGAFLGPLEVQVRPRTTTLVYAVGSPRKNSMRVISHRTDIATDGSERPRRIETGSAAGLASGLTVDVLGR